ncbi:MAG: sigma-70 family RNA polymerase sigma factor [Bacteroidota bacterium]
MSSQDFSDQDLIAQIKRKGFRAEKEAAYIFKKLIAYCHKLKVSTSLSDTEYLDAVNQGTLALITAIRDGRYDGKAKIWTYAYKIVHHKCVNISKEPENNSSTETGQLPDDSETTNLMEDSYADRQRELIQAAMEKLSPACWNMIDARLQTLKHKDIAALFNLASANSARQMYHKCFGKFARITLDLLVPKLKQPCRDFMRDWFAKTDEQSMLQRYGVDDGDALRDRYLLCLKNMQDYLGLG